MQRRPSSSGLTAISAGGQAVAALRGQERSLLHEIFVSDSGGLKWPKEGDLMKEVVKPRRAPSGRRRLRRRVIGSHGGALREGGN